MHTIALQLRAITRRRREQAADLRRAAPVYERRRDELASYRASQVLWQRGRLSWVGVLYDSSYAP
jgi:hypothetical protein